MTVETVQSVATKQRSEPPPRPLALLGALAYSLAAALANAICHAARIANPLRRLVQPNGVEFYEGTVAHTRLKPKRHSLDYKVRYLLVDLDHAARDPSGFAASQVAQHMSAEQARKLAGSLGRVRLLLLPRSANYEQNPLTIYYCYDRVDDLACCIAEVTNTPWGDRVAFPFAPSGDDLGCKPLHVSPFQDMKAAWRLSAISPADELRVSVACVDHPELGDFFRANLSARRVNVKDPERWCFLMAHAVALWIYWHALLLLVWRGLAFFSHPKYDHGADYRASVCERARAAGWTACPAVSRDLALSKGVSPRSVQRPFVWSDADDDPWR